MINNENTNKKITTKARYWVAVLYPENMIEDWQDKIGDLLEVPYCYCIHDKDTTSKDEEDRKTHLHLITVYNSPTTYKHALDVYKLLGVNSVNTCEPIINIRSKYDYLIHNTETCRKKGKHLYDVSERISGNNFDIGSYEQISIIDIKRMRMELSRLIIDENFKTYTDFYMHVISNFSDEFEDVVSRYSGHFERLCKGNYLKSLH